MNILAIDTTTKKANIGVMKNEDIQISSIDNEVTHSEKLLPLIDDTIKNCNLNIKDINILACTTGPGSFTGIRIGLSTVKALSKVIGAKIYEIDSLYLLASSTDIKNYKLVVSLINAKNCRAYTGIYLNEGDELKPAICLENKYLNEILDQLDTLCSSYNISADEVIVIADTDTVLESIPSKYKHVLSSLDMNVLLKLALNSSNFTDYLKLDATYVRSSEAERTKYGE